MNLRRALRYGFLWLVVWLLPAGAAAQNTEPLPTAAEIISKVIERARWVEENKPARNYTFQEHVVVEKLDDNDQVKEREERIFQLVRIEGEPYLRLVQKDGKPPTEDDLKDEAKREAEFRERLAERKQGKSDDEGFRFDRELVSKYRGQVLGRDTVNGRPAYVLHFEPKSDDLPVRKRIDRLTNKLAGKLWIDAQDYAIVKAEGSLIEPARVGWGLIANFTQLDFSVQMVRLDNSFYLPQRLDAALRGRVVFSSTHERRIFRWTNFQKNEAAVQKGATR